MRANRPESHQTFDSAVDECSNTTNASRDRGSRPPAVAEVIRGDPPRFAASPARRLRARLPRFVRVVARMPFSVRFIAPAQSTNTTQGGSRSALASLRSAVSNGCFRSSAIAA